MAIDDDFIQLMDPTKLMFKRIENLNQKKKGFKYILENQNQSFIFKENEVLACSNQDRSDQISLIFNNISPQINLVEEQVLNESGDNQIRYKNLYSGIDTIFYVNNGYLEQDYIVNPTNNPNQIEFTIKNATNIEVDQEGNLMINKNNNQYKLLKPETYQEINAQKQIIESSYCLKDNQTIGFSMGEYDPNLTLIIDPIFDFSMPLNHEYETEEGLTSNKLNNASAMTKDSAGNIYVLTTETTYVEANFVEEGGSENTTFTGFLVIRKFNPDGEQIGDDIVILKNLMSSVTLAAIGTDIAIDKEDNIYVTGAIMDPLKVIMSIFAQMPGIGALIILVFWLITQVLGYDKLTNQVIYPSKNALLKEVTGIITSFIVKIGPEGTQKACTYIGGEPTIVPKEEWDIIMKEFWNGNRKPLQTLFANIMMNMTFVNKVKIDKSGAVWVTGSTNSSKFSYAKNKIHGNRHDAFLMKLNNEFSRADSFYFIGGELSDFGLGLELDEKENSKDYDVYVVGEAEVDIDLTQRNVPGMRGKFEVLHALHKVANPNATSSGFVAKFSSSGIPKYITLYRGNRGETLINDVVVNSDGMLYIIGSTEGGTPITKESYQKTHLISPTQYVGFISKMDGSSQNVVASTYLGGSKDYTGGTTPLGTSFLPYISFSTGTINLSNRGVLKSIALDSNGFIYVTGESGSCDFPMTQEAYQPVLLGRSDCILAKLDSELSELVYSTYFGGSERDAGNQLVVDPFGNMYVVGQTASTDFPFSQDQFPTEAQVCAVFFKIPSIQTVNVINVPDINLKKALNHILNHKALDDITEGDLLRLPSVIDLSHHQIYDIRGLEYAKYLLGLYLQDNQIEDISLLSSLTLLKFIDLATNNLSDLSCLYFVNDGYFANQSVNVNVTVQIGTAILTLDFLKNKSNAIPLIRDISDHGIYNEAEFTVTWHSVSVGQILTFNFGYPDSIQTSGDATFNGSVIITCI